MKFNICETGTSIPVSTINFHNDDFKRSFTYPCSRSLLESRVALRIKCLYEEHARVSRISYDMRANLENRSQERSK